ncbi:hypothetical protein [Atopobium sp. oral taxon 416]|uniref:hypothetical protein n=1 Tax=Atopobium sp. oral taxon 416 TaxID=712157 RepID=UPI001BA4BC44|nr:hypothetical protein [Atopobium sp. oral taxon 416]QUC04639.1 hypothetical protein J4859_06900 [Atopobium sp. oral taxon 416]
MQFYFCDPHHLWQKLTVKNTNGLLREFFPQGQRLRQGHKRGGAACSGADLRQGEEGPEIQDSQRGL